MLSIQHLYHTAEELTQALASVDRNKSSLVQIFTSELEPSQALELAQQVQSLLPLAQVIGSSVSSVIYHGEQYDCHTLITVEQYQSVLIRTQLLPFNHQTYSDLASSIHSFWREGMPQLLRMFVGAYYDYAHQLVNALNVLMPSMRLAGGISGELCQSQATPFVFTSTEVVDNGLVFAGLVGEHLSLYHRIHTSHEPISPAYTITKVQDKAICEIEHQPAQRWLQRNLGFLSTKQYHSWEEIAANDPLVHFQLALTSHPRALRFVHYNETTDQISQYFSRLDAGAQFRISYTSPAKCVEECAETCREVRKVPMEQLFCYSCLFRKLYLKNCAQWELSPFHQNPVSGVFLLGEFGYSDHGNTLLNGSCVLTGIGEVDHYLSVDLNALDELTSIQDDSEHLLDFIQSKQEQPQSEENRLLLDDMIARENTYQSNMFHYLDPHLNMDNMLKYELDKDVLGYDKLCLMKIENADILMSYLGAANYFRQLKNLVSILNQRQTEDAVAMAFHSYTINGDTFGIAAGGQVDRETFIYGMHQLQRYSEVAQEQFRSTPFMLRFAVVFGEEFLLEQAYSLLESNKNSQSTLIVDQSTEVQKSSSRADLESINLIQYALAQDEVIPYYQGIYNNDTHKIDCYEALMRIRDRSGKILAPFHFMEASKKYRLYLDLNLRMFEAVLHDFEQIDCAVNINLSAHDIASPRFRYVMRQRLKSFPKPSNLTFEILEDEYFTDMGALKEFITEVRSYGVKVAIDDFGSGYSNLLGIIKIRPDYLKIDGQIIREIHKAYENEVIVDVISSLGKKLSIDLVAEYVENADIQKIVEKYCILRSQGYHFSKPRPFHEIITDEASTL